MLHARSFSALLFLAVAAACATTAWHRVWKKPCGELTSEQIKTPARWVEPDYPSDARASSTGGWVVLRVTLGTNGEVTDAVVAKSSPRGVFDEAALRAVAQWQYCPPSQVAVDYPEPLLARVEFRPR